MFSDYRFLINILDMWHNVVNIGIAKENLVMRVRLQR